MRIAYFTESMLPLVDGVSHTLRHLLDTLEARGIEFRVYSPFVPDASLAWSHRIRRVRSVAFPLRTEYRVSVPWRHGLGRELDAYRPDLVHVVSPTPLAFWAQRHARRRAIPVAASFHTDFVAYFRYYGLGALEAFGWTLLCGFYRRCTEVYAPSEVTVRELRTRGVDKVRLWTRGVDAARFSPRWRDEGIRARLGASGDAPLVLLVSRLVKEKDLADLVVMDRLLRERGCVFRLALVGDGPMRAELERALPHAHFAGHQSGEALSRWYASADLFVFPSTTETFANVVLEAMASGLPAVVVDRGGPQSVIRPGSSGLVARSNDPSHLADHVESLIRDTALRQRMARAARKQARARDWDRVNEVLVTHYERLVSGSGHGTPSALQSA